MHTPSVFVTTVALLSTFAVAEVERPKFYFPRQIKREVVNKVVARPVPRQVTPATPKRQILDGNGIFPFGAVVTGDTTTTSSSASDTDVVTVVVSSTVFAGDAGTTTSDTQTTSTSEGGILFGPGGILGGDSTTTSAAATTTSDSATTTSDSGVSGPATGTQLSDATTTADATSDATTTADAATTTADAATTTSGGNLDLGGGLTSVISDISTALDPATTTNPPADATTTTSAATDPATTTAPVDPVTTEPVVSDPVITAPATTATDLGTATVTPPATDSATIPVATDLPIANGTATLPPDAATTLPPDAVTTLPPGVNPPNGTAIGTGPITDALPPTGINTSGVSPIETGTVDGPTNGTIGIAPAPTTTDPSTVSGDTDGAQITPGPQTILPTATNADTTQFVPTEIFFAPSPTDTGDATTTETGIPSALPKVIAPLGGAPDLPVDNTMVQVGFTYPLNYGFVVSQWKSQVQIFQFLPEGIADGLGLSRDDVLMHSLVPYDTTTTLGFITTIGNLMIPTNKVNQLRVGLLTPLSPLYQNDDGSINTLMNLINPAIDIIPGSTLAAGGGGSDGATGTDGDSAATPSAGTGNSGIFNTDEQTQQTPQKSGQVAGVAFAAVSAAAAYGAAMFFIARRYKRKRSLHRRASSINPGEMRQTGSPALMGGALTGGRSTPGTDRNSRGSGRTGNSARTAQISAPMMAENSLGWN